MENKRNEEVIYATICAINKEWDRTWLHIHKNNEEYVEVTGFSPREAHIKKYEGIRNIGLYTAQKIGKWQGKTIIVNKLKRGGDMKATYLFLTHLSGIKAEGIEADMKSLWNQYHEEFQPKYSQSTEEQLLEQLDFQFRVDD